MDLSNPPSSAAPPADTAGFVPTVDLAAEAGRSDFYQRAAQQHLAPLWRVLHGLVTETPMPRCVPALWRYAQVRPYVMESCAQISTAEAERRVMVLENPGLPGQSRITQACSPACRSSCRARWRRPIAMLPRPCASSSRGATPSLPWAARRR